MRTITDCNIYYTDGALSTSTNTGGIGIVGINYTNNSHSVVFSYSKQYKNTTINRMELIAVITVLSIIPDNFPVTIYTDSMYVIGCASLNWQRNKNIDLWKIYDKYSKTKIIELVHIKGHSGNSFNSLCDRLAVQASLE